MLKEPKLMLKEPMSM